MVCEACEFQDHYLSMAADVAVVLNVDADHLDYFGSLENVIASFRRFASGASRVILANGDDENTRKALEGITEKPVILYGLDERYPWHARNIAVHDGSYGEYDLIHNGVFQAHIRLGVPGKHNIANSVAAAAAANLCGATAEQIADGLESFHGAGRRFEFLGTFSGVTIADDYAHHPTEISATISARQGNGLSAGMGCFPAPHLYPHRQTSGRLCGILSLRTRVSVSDIMGSREENTVHVSSSQITDRHPRRPLSPHLPGNHRLCSGKCGAGRFGAEHGRRRCL